MSGKTRFCGWKGKLKIVSAVLFAAATLWAAPMIAAAIDSAGAKRPGEVDPYQRNHTMMRADSIFTIMNYYTGGIGNRNHAALVSGIIPDSGLAENKTKDFSPQYEEITGLKYDSADPDPAGKGGPQYASVRMSKDNSPYLLAAGKASGDGNGDLTIKAYLRSSLQQNGAAAAVFSLKDADGTAERIFVKNVLTGDFDGDGDPDCIIVAGVQPTSGAWPQMCRYFKFVSGFTKDKDGKVTIKGASRWLKDEELFNPCQETLGDVDGDGRMELVVVGTKYEGPNGTMQEPIFRVFKIETGGEEAQNVPKFKLSLIDTYRIRIPKGSIAIESYGYFRQARPWQICVSTGDVDGDKKDEIFATYIWGENNNPDGSHQYHSGGVLRLNDKRKLVLDASIAVDELNIGNDDNYKRAFTRSLLADVDGDGKDELVIGESDGSHIWLSCAKYRSGQMTKDHFKWERIWNHTTLDMDMAAGNFYGTFTQNARDGNKMQVVVTGLERLTGDNHLAFTALYTYDSASGKFKEGYCYYVNKIMNKTDRVMINPRICTVPPLQLVVDDFTNKSLQLGKPIHIVKENEDTLLTYMQEPPKHCDYTLNKDSKYGVMNLTRVSDFYTDFHSKETSSTGVKTGQITDNSLGVSMSAEVGMGHKAKLKGVGGHDVGVDFAASAAKSWENKDATYKEHYKSTSTSIKTATKADDYLGHSLTTTDIWRYPILNRKSNGPVSKDQQLYHTAAVPAPISAQNSVASSLYLFQPTWCHGNLLSYPRTLKQLGDYLPANVLAKPTGIDVARNSATQAIDWTEEVKKSKEKSDKKRLKKDASVTVHLSAEYMGWYVNGKFKTAVASDQLDETTSVNSTAFSTATGFQVQVDGSKFPETFPADSAGYKITTMVYNTPALAKKVAYLVDIPGSNAWWTQRYSGAADPALNLPNLWRTSGGNNWAIDDNTDSNPNARRIRGFFVVNSKKFRVGPGIEESKPVSLYCRVHNFSMKADDETDDNARATAKNVPVRFEYQKLEHNKPVGSRVKIGDTTVAKIPVWNNTAEDANYDYAAVSWDVTKLADSNYRIWVTVNPDKKVKELPHHGLNEAADNNRGWFDVATKKPINPKQASVLIQEGLLEGDALEILGTDEDDEFYEIGSVDLCDMDNDFTMSLADGEVAVSSDITNKGNTPALNVYVTLCRKNGGELEPLDTLFFPGIMPGETIPVTLDGALEDNYSGDLVLQISSSLEEINIANNTVTKNLGGGSGSGGGCNAGAGTGAVLALIAAAAISTRRGKK